MVKNIEVKAGMGFLGWLTLLFIGLKLTGYITWSWWWVLAAFWIPGAILVIVLTLMVIMVMVTIYMAEPRGWLK